MQDDDRAYTDVVGFPARVVMEPIARVRSNLLQRHGAPRQPGACSPVERGDEVAQIILLDHLDPLLLRDLDGFDHLWVLSWFHLNGARRKPLVRPPRGGRKRGVLATRSPHRPNNLGLSLARIIRVEGRIVDVRGLDLLDGTPVLDLKPYIPDFDARPDALRGWLDDS